MLKGRTALVTGSTSGIGWATAQALARLGCRVVLHGSRADDDGVRDKVRIIESLSEDGCRASPGYLRADLREAAQCRDLAVRAMEALGGQIDILVNNAGMQHTAPVEEFPPDQWNQIISVNLSAAFLISQAVVPQMYKRNFGRLIHIGSVLSTIGAANKVAYCAAKHGLVGMSKVFALEGAGQGVTSNVICPAWVLTPIAEKQVDALVEKEGISLDEAKTKILAVQPTGEFILPESVAEMVVFLCNPQHSSHVTGSTMMIDGGLSVH